MLDAAFADGCAAVLAPPLGAPVPRLDIGVSEPAADARRAVRDNGTRARASARLARGEDPPPVLGARADVVDSALAPPHLALLAALAAALGEWSAPAPQPENGSKRSNPSLPLRPRPRGA